MWEDSTAASLHGQPSGFEGPSSGRLPQASVDSPDPKSDGDPPSFVDPAARFTTTPGAKPGRASANAPHLRGEGRCGGSWAEGLTRAQMRTRQNPCYDAPSMLYDYAPA